MRRRGGGPSSPSPTKKRPSFYWAVLHNWLYCISLCFNAINIQFLIRGIVDGDTSATPSPEAIALSGKVEGVDKFLTFAGIGFLSALSDKYGRKPLLAWSAFGFGLTNLVQALTKTSVVSLYIADFIDGCSSCMTPLCQSYVCDVSPPAQRAANLGVFQGISVGLAFVLGFPIGGILGAKYGPRFPLLIAAALQLLNALIIVFITPESNNERVAKLDLKQDNPIGGLHRLFGHTSLLRTVALTYFLTSLARSSLDAQFTNYSSIRFGWTSAQSGPVLVIVGLMLAVAPRLLVPLLGMKNAILSGLLVFAAGLATTGLAPTSTGFVMSIFVVSIGCACIPALQAVLSNLAAPGERGALLGAVGSLNELTGAIGSTMWASTLAKFTSDNAPIPNLPGMHFMVAAGLLVVAWAVALQGFIANKNHPALFLKGDGNNNTT
jgi:DHA1 family tetracycline resistance protein-like MFS transporter